MAGCDPLEGDEQQTEGLPPVRSLARRGRLRWLFVAAFLLVAAAAGLWFLRPFCRTGGKDAIATSETAAPSRSPNEARQLEAMGLADRLIEEFPESYDAYYVRGLLLARYGQAPEAAKCWEQCLRLAPNFAPACELLGVDAQKRGEFKKAVSLLKKALEVDPRLPEAALRLAEALTDMNRPEEAVTVLEKHLAVWPRSPEGLFRLGQAHLKRKAYAEAKKCYQATVEIEPTFMLSYFGLATACERLGETDRAKEYRQKFDEMKRSHRSDETRRRREHDDRAMLREAAADEYTPVGKVYFAHGRVREAEGFWRKAAASHPEHTESRKMLVVALVQEGKLREALQVLEELQQIEPDNPEHQVSIGTLNARLKQFEAAETALKRAIQLAPRRGEGPAALAKLYLQTGRNLPEAKALAQQAADWRPSAANFFILSSACARNGDLPDARAAILRAIQIDPVNPVYQEAYNRLQKTRMAIQWSIQPDPLLPAAKEANDPLSPKR